MSVLVTGGAGFIGSHTIVNLLESGYDVVAIDNLVNSKPGVFRRIQDLTGRPVEFHQMDVLDSEGLERVFRTRHIEFVIHFAGLKSLAESISQPRRYWMNNVVGTLVLTEVMERN